MAFAAKSAFNPMSVSPNGCLISSPSLVAPSKISYSHPYLSVPHKPTKFQLCCKPVSSLSLTSLFYLNRKDKSFVSALGENNPTVLEGAVGDEEEVKTELSWGTDETEVEGEEAGFPSPPEGAKVYVGNLPFDVDSQALGELFEQAGVVEVAEVIYDRMSGNSRGFGFVTMSTVEEANKAVGLFSGSDMNGRTLTVNIAAAKGSRPPARETGHRIYVGNLPWDVDSSALEEIFSEYGVVVSARVVSDRETGRSRGFGFVEMSTEPEMSKAISNLDGQDLNGRPIKVNAALERQSRPPRF